MAMNFPRLFAPASFVCLSLLLPSAALCATTEKDLLQTVVTAFETNYSSFPALDVELARITDDRTALANQTEPILDKSKKTKLTLEVRPRREWKEHLLLEGKNLLYRSYAPDGSPVETLFLKGDVWTMMPADVNRVDISEPRQMPDMFPVDPREIGSTSIKQRLIDALLADRSEEVKLITGAESAVQIRVVNRQRGNVKTEYLFDSRANLLPVSVKQFFPDGTVSMACDIVYQDVPGSKAKFLKTAVRKFFMPGRAASSSSEKWHEQNSYEVVRLKVLKKLGPETFHLDIPEGTVVSDNTRGLIYTNTKQDSPQASSFPAWWVPALAIVLVISLLYLLYRRRASRNARTP